MIRNALLLLVLTAPGKAQATFSIVAVDPATREVGGAGASCIPASVDISDINALAPGKGAVNAQASWHLTNRDNALVRLEAGDSPAQALAWLHAHDESNDPENRQFGLVDLDAQGKPRSAGFSGTRTLAYSNHVLGPEYAIQGNILSGAPVLDSMRAKYLRSQGQPLAYRLMAAMQGAKLRGADSRCQPSGTSSQSAFIRLARASDPKGKYALNLVLKGLPRGVEPIDSLQKLFNLAYRPSGPEPVRAEAGARLRARPGRLEAWLAVPMRLELLDLQGRKLRDWGLNRGEAVLSTRGLPPGLCILRFRRADAPESGSLILLP